MSFLFCNQDAIEKTEFGQCHGLTYIICVSGNDY